MQAKKMGCFLSMLLLFSVFIYNVNAAPTTVSFHGVGVTIDLTFPEEAHPDTNMTHYITITSSTEATLRNFTVVIKAPVTSGWQEIFNAQDTFSKSLPVSYNLTLSLPQEANGRLQCSVFVNTSIIDDLSTTVYTTLVSEPTFSEIQSRYDALLESYNLLNATYTALNENFTVLWANYTALLSEHNQLTANYNSKDAAYASLLAQYNKLSDDYDTLNTNYRSKITELGDLQTDYEDLNSTRYSLQTSYDTLQTIYDGLNQTYTDLQTQLATLQERINVSEGALNSDRIVLFIFVMAVAGLIGLIIYIKRKEAEPYVVIRKETVAVKPDEES